MTELSDRPVSGFLADLASDAPTPGGGTAAAIAGAMGAGLMQMVVALTLGREKFAAAHDRVRPIGESADVGRSEFLRLAAEDAAAYDGVVQARRLPKDTDAEKKERAARITAATRGATEIPMRTAELAVHLLSLLPELAQSGNPNAASDAGAAALLLEASAEAALLNVAINLPAVSDTQFAARMQRETADLQQNAQRLRSHVLAAVRKKI